MLFAETGAPLAAPESIDLPMEKKTMLGSGMIVEAASVDEVKSMLQGDVYWNEGVVSSVSTVFPSPTLLLSADLQLLITFFGTYSHDTLHASFSYTLIRPLSGIKKDLLLATCCRGEQ